MAKKEFLMERGIDNMNKLALSYSYLRITLNGVVGVFFMHTRVPTHIGIILQGSTAWAKQHKTSVQQAYSKRFYVVIDIIKSQIELKIPVLTLYLLRDVTDEALHLMEKIDSLADFLSALSSSEFIHKNSIKVTVLGKWYDLPGRIVDSIKKIIDETKEYDKYFLNLCINYDGQEEIVDACQLIAMKIKAGKLDPEAITKQMVKEDIYMSYFMPPELIIRTGEQPKLRSFLLWDASDATIYFSEKLWPDFTKHDFSEAINYWRRYLV